MQRPVRVSAIRSAYLSPASSAWVRITTLDPSGTRAAISGVQLPATTPITARASSSASLKCVAQVKKSASPSATTMRNGPCHQLGAAPSWRTSRARGSAMQSPATAKPAGAAAFSPGGQSKKMFRARRLSGHPVGPNMETTSRCPVSDHGRPWKRHQLGSSALGGSARARSRSTIHPLRRAVSARLWSQAATAGSLSTELAAPHNARTSCAGGRT